MKQKIKIMLSNHCFGQILCINADFHFIHLKEQGGFYRFSTDSENVDYFVVQKLLETSSVSEGTVPEIDYIMQKMAICCL